MKRLDSVKLLVIAIILIFIAIFINNEVTRIRLENKEILKKISILEKEKIYYEDLLVKKVSLIELENKARKIGLLYPDSILEIKIENGKIKEVKKEKYLIISSHHDKL
ncbi:MAG: hypothetical protein ABDH25_03250 [Dictyoglomaceae bacterium]